MNIPERTVLCVDDDKLFLSSLRRLLRHHKHLRVLTALGAREAMTILEKEKIDVVLADLRMPEIPGDRLLDYVKQRYPSALRILITGYADMEAITRTVNDGSPDRFFLKPYDEIALIRAVNGESRKAAGTGKSEPGERHALEIDTVGKLLLEIQFLVDYDLGGHALRVAEQVSLFARKAGLEPAEIKTLEYAALFHDLGLIRCEGSGLTLPEIMDYNEILENAETETREHPLIGERLVSMIPDGMGAARIIRHHHEHWNGGGYPDGLSGTDIPLGSRILRIVDAYDELVFLENADPRTAVRSIMERADKEFDKELAVDFFIDVAGNSPPGAMLPLYFVREE